MVFPTVIDVDVVASVYMFLQSALHLVVVVVVSGDIIVLIMLAVVMMTMFLKLLYELSVKLKF